MRICSTRAGVIGAVGVLALAAAPARAVLLYRSATRNTSAPTGDLANSGWQLEGDYGGFLGTPIGPHWFITANHIGGAASVPLVLNGVAYNVDASYNGGLGYIRKPGTDIKIWHTVDAFPTWAQLYDDNADGSEVGKELVDIGRGTTRGDPVYAETTSDNNANAKPGELKGWKWGVVDGVRSWGTNLVSDLVVNGGTDFGTLYTFAFDRDGLPDEAMLSANDSSGGVFVQGADGTWKLAGINAAADGTYRYSAPVNGVDTDGFNAALFDSGGMYELTGANNQYTLIPEQSGDVATYSYFSPISPNLSWIRSIIGNPATISVPEPAAAAVALSVAIGSTAIGRRRRQF